MSHVWMHTSLLHEILPGRFNLQMPIVLGVDGGSTKTVAVAADLDGRVRGVGRAGCSNWEGVGLAAAASSISACIGQALTMAGAQPEDVAHIHLGLAGLDWPDDEPRLRGALANRPWADRLTMENDSFLSVRAGASSGRGVGAMAGSGVCACIIPEQGPAYSYGGFIDKGGGIDIDARVVHAVVRAADGRGPATAMSRAVLAAAGCREADEFVHGLCRRDIRLTGGVLRPILFGAAADGDPVALAIVTEFGRELGLAATTLLKRYGLTDGSPDVVGAGSLLVKTGPVLYGVFCQEVLLVAPRARVALLDLPPVLGAVRAALEAYGCGTPAVWEEVRRTAPDEKWFRTEGQ